jgi:hypothetical protein
LIYRAASYCADYSLDCIIVIYQPVAVNQIFQEGYSEKCSGIRTGQKRIDDYGQVLSGGPVLLHGIDSCDSGKRGCKEFSDKLALRLCFSPGTAGAGQE